MRAWAHGIIYYTCRTLKPFFRSKQLMRTWTAAVYQKVSCCEHRSASCLVTVLPAKALQRQHPRFAEQLGTFMSSGRMFDRTLMSFGGAFGRLAEPFDVLRCRCLCAFFLCFLCVRQGQCQPPNTAWSMAQGPSRRELQTKHTAWTLALVHGCSALRRSSSRGNVSTPGAHRASQAKFQRSQSYLHSFGGMCLYGIF